MKLVSMAATRARPARAAVAVSSPDYATSNVSAARSSIGD
jgi:hypothetical protein